MGIKVLVVMEGGIVQDIIADRSGVEVIVIDYDGEESLRAIPQPGGGCCPATLYEVIPDIDAVWIEAARNAEEIPEED